MTAEEYMEHPKKLREKAKCLHRVRRALREKGDLERADAVTPYIEKTEKECAYWHRRVAARIALLPDENERRALTLRYLEGLTPLEVADCMAYCERQVYRFMRSGVLHMEGILAG